MASADWKLVSLPALNAPFDARSLPSELVPGAFRWKQNFSMNSSGRLSRRSGHRKLFSYHTYDGLRCSDMQSMEGGAVGCNYNNSDFHDQKAATREIITFLHEHTAADASRTLFCGSKTRIQYYDQDTGDWTKITGVGITGSLTSRWSAASMTTDGSEYVIFTNNVDAPLIYTLGDANAVTLAGLDAIDLTKARVVFQMYGHVVLCNTEEEDGKRYAMRVRWSDHADPEAWETGGADNLAGYQDLEYGEEILAVAPLAGSMMIYTSKSIYRMYYTGSSSVADDDTGALVFGFQRVYHEPKNRIGCLAYPSTLVSTGDAHYYMGRDGIYKWNSYSIAPEREEWVHASSAIIFSSRYSSEIDGSKCEAPCAEITRDDKGDAREVIFSWPSKTDASNAHSLACNIQHKTCDYIDYGYTSFVNFNQASECNTGRTAFIGASGADWCLKEIGSPLYWKDIIGDNYTMLAGREDITSAYASPEENITEPVYVNSGYNSILRGEIPTLQWPGLEKTVRRVVVEHETETQSEPCKLSLKIGNSRAIRDANVSTGKQAVQWHTEPELLLISPDEKTVAQLTAANLRPDYQTDWNVYWIGRHLYYDLTIKGAGTAKAVGGQTDWARIDFEIKIGA